MQVEIRNHILPPNLLPLSSSPSPFLFFLREMLEPPVLPELRVLLDCRECLVSVVPVVFQD